MYSGSPTELVERGAAISLSLATAIALFTVGCRAFPNINLTVSGIPSAKVFQQISVQLESTLTASSTIYTFADSAAQLELTAPLRPSVLPGKVPIDLEVTVWAKGETTGRVNVILESKLSAKHSVTASSAAVLENALQAKPSIVISASLKTWAIGSFLFGQTMYSGSWIELVEGGAAISPSLALAIAPPTVGCRASSDVNLSVFGVSVTKVSQQVSAQLKSIVTTSPTTCTFAKGTAQSKLTARPIVSPGKVSIDSEVIVRATGKPREHVGVVLELRLSAQYSVIARSTAVLKHALQARPSVTNSTSIQISTGIIAQGIGYDLRSVFTQIELSTSAHAGIGARASFELSSQVGVKPSPVSKSTIQSETSITATAFISSTARINLLLSVSGLWQPKWRAQSKPKARLRPVPTVTLPPKSIDPRLIIGGVDLSGRLVSWTLRFENDAGSWTLDVELTNHYQLVANGLGLAPWDPNSIYNRDRPLLGSYNPVTLEIKKEGWTAWKKLFTGFAGPASVSAPERWGEANHIRATFVGISQPLKDWMIEERLALRYTNAAISKEGRPDLLNRIVMDQGFSVRIEYQDDPMFMVDEYIVSHVSLWEALENALAPTGFRLIEKWSPVTGETTLTVVDPLRFKQKPDRVQVGGFSARDIAGYEADVRTWVGVVYRDRTDFQEKLVWAEADPKIVATYGIPDGRGGRKHRKMIYKTSARSLVDTESEARELASMILWDLETPSPTVEITIPVLDETYFPFELVEFEGDYFSTLVGILDIEHSWSWDRNCGQTVLRGAKGKVVGARQLWFTRDTRRGYSREFQELEESTERAYMLTPSKPTIIGSWFQNIDGTPKPVIDLLFPTPPPWADGIILKIMRFTVKDSGLVLSQSGANIVLFGKNYLSGTFQGPCGDYLVYYEEDGSGTPIRINTVSGNTVYLSQAPGRILRSGERVTIVRLKRTETRTIQLTRFYRIEDVVENEVIGVCFAWRGRK